MSIAKLSTDPKYLPLPLVTAPIQDFLSERCLNDPQDRTKFLWTEWERLYLPILVLADHSDVEDVKLDDQGRIWVSLFNSQERVISRPYGSSLRLQELDYGDYGIDHPIVRENYVLMMSHGWNYLCNRTRYRGIRIRHHTLSDFVKLIEEPEIDRVSVFMFTGLHDYLYSTSYSADWSGFEIGGRLRPYAEDAYYEDTLRAYLPPFKGDYTKADLLTARALRQSVIQNLSLKAQRQGRAVLKQESENLASRTNAFWWIAKGSELRSVDTLVRRGVITQETVDRWL